MPTTMLRTELEETTKRRNELLQLTNNELGVIDEEIAQLNTKRQNLVLSRQREVGRLEGRMEFIAELLADPEAARKVSPLVGALQGSTAVTMDDAGS